MKNSFNIFKDYFKYLRAYRRYLGLKIFILLPLSLLAVAADSLGIMMVLPLLKVVEFGKGEFGYISTLIVGIINFMGIPQTTLGILIFMGSLFLFKGFVKFGEGIIQWYFFTRLNRELKSQMVIYYTNIEHSFYSSKNVGHFVNIINQQIGGFLGSFTSFIKFNSRVITTVAYLSIACMVNWLFTFSAIAMGIFLLMMFRFLSNKLRRLSVETSYESGLFNKFLIQLLQSLKYLISTSSVEVARNSALKSISKLANLKFRMKTIMVLVQSIQEPLSIAFIIMIVLVQTIIFSEPLGPIFAAVLLFYRALNSTMALQISWQGVMNSSGGLKMTLDEFVAVKKNLESQGPRKVGEFKDKIVFDCVSYSYGTADVLKDLSLTIHAGNSMAIVGESGAGKSTLIDLITLFLKPNIGSLTVDGIPYQELDYKDWRMNIGMVTQETVIFDDSIANNISLWSSDYEKDDACRHRVEEAAKSAYCHKFINELPYKYSTVVGDRGMKLSGGQRQRLAIARELYKRPKILILDEATSSLDAESERYIKKSVDDMKGKMTILIVAHRLSTVKNVDRIFVLKKGRIIENGCYDELSKMEKSEFSQMVAMQKL